MAINKVELSNDDGTKQVLVDLTGDTVTPETLMQGATAHNKSGLKISGNAKPGKPEQIKNFTFTENGIFPIKPDADKVLSGGSVEVKVPNSSQETVNLTLSAFEEIDIYYSGEKGEVEVFHKTDFDDITVKCLKGGFMCIENHIQFDGNAKILIADKLSNCSVIQVLGDTIVFVG